MDFIFDPSLVLYLPLYKLGGASFLSRDKHGHLCTVTGAVWRPNGHSFDSTDDYITIPDLGLSNSLTVELWLKPSDITAYALIITNPQGFAVGLWKSGGGGDAVGIISTPHSARVSRFVTGLRVAVGKWLHLTITYDASGMPSYYYNGVQNTNYLANNNWSSPGSYIGRRASGSYYGGQIGEVRVYRRALTFPEIQRNYLATKWRYR